MKKIDKILGITLAIVSILSCVANYFGMLATPLLVAGFVMGVFVSAIAMVETYHYQEYDNQNSSWFWFIFSAAFGVILVMNFYATGIGIANERLGLAIMMGLWPTIMPILGVFFGDIGRILFKGEPSVI